MHVHKLHTVAGAARAVGIGRSSIHAAIRRGSIRVFKGADGYPHVLLSEVEAYRDSPSKVGRPRKKRGK